MTHLSERIRAARKARGLNQTQYGAALGVAQTTVAEWEAGRRHPRRHLWPRMVQMSGGHLRLQDFVSDATSERANP